MNITYITRIIGMACILLMLATPVAAQADGQMRLSYCKGEVATYSQIGTQGENTVEAASYIPADMVSYYQNLRVVGINAGLASKLNVVSLTVWVRSELDGENIMEQTLDTGSGQTIVKGWNNISFKDTKSIVTDKGFFVGYTIRQKGSCYAISAVGDDHEGGLYINTDNNWEDKCEVGLGTLSIETIIEADNLPTYDLAATGIELSHRVQKGTTVPVKLYVSNMASRTISEFDVVYNIDKMGEVRHHVLKTILPCDEDSVIFDFTPDFDRPQNDMKMEVMIADLKEGNDIDMSNNSTYTYFDFVKFDFSKKVLLEEFTTENCPNCPQAIEIITKVLEDEEFSENVLAISHHSGYITDWLTTDADIELLYLYGTYGTYAPAIMYDRYTEEDIPVRQVDTNGDIKNILRQRLATPSNAAIMVTAKGDAWDNTIDVTVSGGLDSSFSLSDPHITVCAVENNIKAVSQSGAGENFMHQHVLRAYNEVWGAPLEWDENGEFVYECELAMDESWKYEDMEIIAFINNYDATSVSNCAVENAARCDIEWINVGIGKPLEKRQILYTEYYDITGKRIDKPDANGVYIKTDHYDDGSIKTEKQLYIK